MSVSRRHNVRGTLCAVLIGIFTQKGKMTHPGADLIDRRIKSDRSIFPGLSGGPLLAYILN